LRRRKSTIVSLLVTVTLTLSLLLAAPAQAAGAPQFFFIPLSGDQEVPARETPASGLALFWLSADEESLRYVLLAFNIENVVFSHIHAPAPAGENAGVVAFLLHDQPPGGGRHDGLLAQGTLTEADLVGTFAGQDFSVLVDAIDDGLAYVNVHTNDGVAPTNTGPGDFPGGELRGQFP
jgi:CHRD domain